MSQFGLLDSLQTAIDAEAGAGEVRLHGVNGIGHESGNASACVGKDLPWLQETPAQPVWTSWAVTYRDVIILDGRNVPVGVYNLTEHSLADPANFAELKALLLAAAGVR